jgi:hypothetical protein
MKALNDEGAFHTRISDLTYPAMFDEIGDELQRQPEARYSEFLKGLWWFLAQGTIPSNFHSWQTDRLRLFACELVVRGMMRSTILDQFSTSAP